MSKIWLCSNSYPCRNSLLPVCLLSWSEASLTPDDVSFTLIISGLEEKSSEFVEFHRSGDREDGNQFLVVGKSRSWRLHSFPSGTCQLCGPHQVFSFSDSCFLGYWTQGSFSHPRCRGDQMTSSLEVLCGQRGVWMVPRLSTQSWGSRASAVCGRGLCAVTPHTETFLLHLKLCRGGAHTADFVFWLLHLVLCWCWASWERLWRECLRRC